MQQTLVPLIEQVRACRSQRDGYEMQREILGRLLPIEEDRNAFSQAAKRMADGKAPQPGVPDPQSGGDPDNVETWIFEREMCERLARQLRAIGDALAWRAFSFDRRFILSWSRNAAPGIMAGKAGVIAERDFMDEQWREHERFVLLHDLTNCLRIGDATEWDTETGGPLIREIKTNSRRKDQKQQRRIRAAHAAAYDGGNLPGGHHDERLHDIGRPLKTHLGLLRTATERAAKDGIFAARVPGSRALLVADMYGVAAQGWSEDEFFRRLDSAWRGARRRARIDGPPEFNIHATSLDTVSRDPLRVPWPVYPLHPVACARLIGDIMTLVVETSGSSLAEDLRARGLDAKWVRPPSTSDLALGEVLMEINKTWPVGAGVNGDWSRTLQTRPPEMDRYLIELIDQESSANAIQFMLDAPDMSERPWPVFRDEHLTWV